MPQIFVTAHLGLTPILTTANQTIFSKSLRQFSAFSSCFSNSGTTCMVSKFLFLFEKQVFETTIDHKLSVIVIFCPFQQKFLFNNFIFTPFISSFSVLLWLRFNLISAHLSIKHQFYSICLFLKLTWWYKTLFSSLKSLTAEKAYQEIVAHYLG